MSREPAPQAFDWLEKKLSALTALYSKFGRDGFKDQSLADITLLLESKRLLLRDAVKGRDLSEQAKAENRKLELEIQDLTAYVKGQIFGLNQTLSSSFAHPGRTPKHDLQQHSRPNQERNLEK